MSNENIFTACVYGSHGKCSYQFTFTGVLFTCECDCHVRKKYPMPTAVMNEVAKHKARVLRRNMYFEEKLINGVMCYRSDPEGEFEPFDMKELSRRYQAAKDRLNALTTVKEATYQNEQTGKI